MLPKFLRKAKNAIDHKFQESTPPVTAFGIFGLINFPLFYIIWRYVTPTEYSNLPMRLVAAVLCLFLIFKKKWPRRLQPFFPLYWYLTITYTLSLFGTFMFLKNHGSATWLTNAMLGLFWLMLVTDWISFMVILPLGIILGLAFYKLNGGIIYFEGNLVGTFSNYIWAVAIAAVFAHNKEKVQTTKLQTIKAIGGSIAHELRTPLRTISLAVSSIKDFFPALLETLQIAKKENLPVPLTVRDYETMLTACDDIESETQASFTVINMLLMNVSQSISTSDLKTCSINHCIDEAIRRYPFDIDEAKLVHWDHHEDDFLFKGKELLIIHVLFNLMKNAFYQIKSARKGDIHIWIEKGTKYNLLHFKDTAKGISPKILPHIFDRFFTKTYHGTGIGLAFCQVVMENLGGKITCDSVEGKYAEFILYFPTNPDLKVIDQPNNGIDSNP